MPPPDRESRSIEDVLTDEDRQRIDEDREDDRESSEELPDEEPSD